MRLFLAFLLLVAACDSPAPQLMGGTPREVSVGDFRYRVFYRPGFDRVEAHRISQHFPVPSRRAILAGALIAIEQTTGCHVRDGSLEGDHALIKARVICSD